jgi:hypothetical protein
MVRCVEGMSSMPQRHWTARSAGCHHVASYPDGFDDGAIAAVRPALAAVCCALTSLSRAAVTDQSAHELAREATDPTAAANKNTTDRAAIPIEATETT